MTESEAWRVLNLEPGTPADQVRQAYLDLVKVWHPDRFEHDARLREKASQSLQRVNEAYAILQGRRLGTAPSPRTPPATQGHTSPPQAPPSPSQPDPPAAPPGATPFWTRRTVLAIGGGTACGVILALALLARGPAPVLPAPPAPSGSDIPLPSSARARAEPRSDPRSELRPESGADLRPGGTRGQAALAIENRIRADAVVELTGASAAARAWYVRSGEKITLLDLASGEYRVRVLTGRGWDGRAFGDPVGFLVRREPLVLAARPREAPPAVTVTGAGREFETVVAFALE